MSNADLPSNAVQLQYATISGTKNECYTGLSKREYFAGLAMQGLLSNPEAGVDEAPNDAAEYAVKQADALLKELEK